MVKPILPSRRICKTARHAKLERSKVRTFGGKAIALSRKSEETAAIVRTIKELWRQNISESRPKDNPEPAEERQAPEVVF